MTSFQTPMRFFHFEQKNLFLSQYRRKCQFRRKCGIYFKINSGNIRPPQYSSVLLGRSNSLENLTSIQIIKFGGNQS
jgi:hypothetical protein